MLRFIITFRSSENGSTPVTIDGVDTRRGKDPFFCIVEASNPIQQAQKSDPGMSGFQWQSQCIQR